jgi:hypothetical protein
MSTRFKARRGTRLTLSHLLSQATNTPQRPSPIQYLFIYKGFKKMEVAILDGGLVGAVAASDPDWRLSL